MGNIAVLTDTNGNFIGQKDRYALGPGDMKAIALLWVTNPKGDVLLAKRSMRKKDDPGLWGPAAAGSLEPGETFESNIIKEADEEIGLKIDTLKEVLRRAYWRDDNGTGRYAVWFHEVVDMPVEAFALQAEEVDEVRWVSKEELRAELSENPSKFVTAQGLWTTLLEI